MEMLEYYVLTSETPQHTVTLGKVVAFSGFLSCFGSGTGQSDTGLADPGDRYQHKMAVESLFGKKPKSQIL